MIEFMRYNPGCFICGVDLNTDLTILSDNDPYKGKNQILTFCPTHAITIPKELVNKPSVEAAISTDVVFNKLLKESGYDI